jgi:hypothetical protein
MMYDTKSIILINKYPLDSLSDLLAALAESKQVKLSLYLVSYVIKHYAVKQYLGVEA